jgi:uncharacterized protein (TIGR02246 family)
MLPNALILNIIIVGDTTQAQGRREFGQTTHQEGRMKRFTVLITLAALTIWLLAGCASMDAKREEADLAAFHAMKGQYAEYVTNADVEGFMSLWDENGSKMHPNVPNLHGTDAIRAFVTPRLPSFEQTMETTADETIYLGDYIVVRGHYTGTATPKSGGATMQVDGKNLTVFKKQADGSWRIYIDCYNSNTP